MAILLNLVKTAASTVDRTQENTIHFEVVDEMLAVKMLYVIGFF